MDFSNYSVVDIKELGKNACFHYTNINNVKNIFERGLEPAIGDNAIGIEVSKKIFFTVGMTNSLILMEAWLRWLMAKSLSDMPGKKLDKPMYRLATSLLKHKIFHPIMTLVVKCELRSKLIRNREFKHLKEILDESVYLVLDLEYGVDYSLQDIDEVKLGNFDKKLLKIMYISSNVHDSYMEYWNMHTFSEKVIEPEKIHLVKVNNLFRASDILQYMRVNSEIKIKKELPLLYSYFKWLDKQNQQNSVSKEKAS